MNPQTGRAKCCSLLVICCLTFLLLVPTRRSPAFSLNGYSWPAGAQIQMRLQLTRPQIALQDGSASWNESAADALAIWNQYIDTVEFVQAAPAATYGGDGKSSAFFSKTMYGEGFPAGVLAVTLNFSDDTGEFTETDVIFNDNSNWNSYRGPRQGAFDFHRVALHEFGHVLGLDHPDEHGQNVSAVMNSIISDLDHLSDDDIAGAKSLYGHPTLTAYLGSDFRYQVVANNNSTSYSAGGLPPGLALDADSGMITGVATISGSYAVVVTANGPTRSVTVTIQINVTAPISNPNPNPGALLKKLDISVNRLAVDPFRSRIYATVPASNSVVVIDTHTLSILKTIPIGPNPVGLAISADRSRLWVANNGSTAEAIGVVDLNTLQALPSFPAPFPPYDLEEGLDNTLYVTSEQSFSGIMRIDSKTGAFQGKFYGASFLEISPDRKTLFVAGRGESPSYITKFDISTSTPVLQQNVFGNGQDLKLSPTGEFICFFIGSSNGSAPVNTLKIPTSNLSASSGIFDAGGTGGPTAWSGDGNVLYEGLNTRSSIAIFDTNSLAKTGQISLGTAPGDSSGYNIRDLIVDKSGAYLFAATSDYPSLGVLRVYATGRTNALPPVLPAPKSLANVSTRLRVQPGEGALIGGFIIQGTDPKQVVVRAVGPSLPLTGKLVDPILEIYNAAGAVIASNDNWNSDRAQVLDSGLAPKDEHEAAIVISLSPGAYTALVRGASNSTGIALVELYDIDSNHSRTANISTRGTVDAGDNVMIGGFIIVGDQPTKVIVRAIGPSLSRNGIANALQDPTLELHNGNGSLLTQNDDWRSLQEEAITSTGIAPNDDRESAVVATLPPGNYTAVVSGKAADNGVALVEIYNLDSN